MSHVTTNWKKAFRKQKSALTRAQNSGDHHKIIRLADEFEKFYEDRNVSVPDDWSRWQRAKEDAQLALRMGRGVNYESHYKD